MEERRYMDKRMDSMEKDIRELRNEQKEIHEVVTSIRETLNNGIKNKIKDTHENMTTIKKEFDDYRKEERVATCYYLQDKKKRESVKDKAVKRVTIYFTIILTVFKIGEIILNKVLS